MIKFSLVSTKAIFLCVLCVAIAQSCLASGPNMMINSGFEGGSQQFDLKKSFTIVDDPSKAHSGSWTLKADLTNALGSASQVFACWANTSYTSTIWYKGTGEVTFQAIGSGGTSVLAATVLTATPNWQEGKLNWNSASFSSTSVTITDDVGKGTMYLDDVSTSLTDGRSIDFDPLRPERSHPKFKLLFDDEFDSSSSIDANKTGAAGYHWYLQSFFDPKYDNNATMFTVSDGHVTIKDAGNPWGEVLDTAHPANNKLGYAGTVFSGGRGLYAVARIEALNVSRWPKVGGIGWWSYDMKGETKTDLEMRGNPGKIEFVENDFLEYNPVYVGAADFISTMHDWGSADQNMVNKNNVVTPPAGTDYSKYHTYGGLWVPASAENGWNGYRQLFFDGIPEQAVCWVGNQIYSGGFPATNESMGSYLFSAMDNDKFQFILGGGQGGIPIMNIDYVRVYAVDTSSVTTVLPGD
jgi:hypothetical protein